MNSTLAAAPVVLRKELRDTLRDRRALLTAMVMPLLGPLLLMGMLRMVAGWARTDRPLKLAVVAPERAPGLESFLVSHGVALSPAPQDFEAQVADGRLEMVLVIPEGYGERFEAGKQVSLELYSDSSNSGAQASVSRVRRLLEGYGQSLGSLRLLARGVNPTVAAPLAVTDVDLATPARSAANALGAVPMFLLLALFVGGMHVAIDATAGERERASLEPLLCAPVPRLALVLGKWGTALTLSLASVAVTAVGFMLTLRHVPLQDLGLRLELGLPALLRFAAVLVPLAALAAGVEVLLALFARSNKEAQTYLSFMMLIPTVPTAFLAFLPFSPAPSWMVIPVWGQAVLIRESLRGEPLPGSWVALASAVAAALCVLCLGLAARQLQKEEIVFGRSS